MKAMRADAQTFLHATFGFWVGIYAFRTFVPTAVWNLSDALPLYAKGALAIGIHLLGLLGCVLPFLRRPRAHFVLACVLALIAVLRQIFLASDVVGSACSLLGWILWLWWLAAFAQNALHARLQHLVAPAFAAGFALQLGMQSVWHGLDLSMVRGPIAVLFALAIHGVFAYTGRAQYENPQPPRVQGTALLVAIGPALFLELTLFSAGRFGFISGLGLLPSVLLLQGALALGLLLTRAASSRGYFVAALATLTIATIAAPMLHGRGALLLLLGQAALIMLLAAAATRDLIRVRSAFAAGTVMLFAFVFLFYNQYEAPPLWILAALLLLLAFPDEPVAAVSTDHAYVIGGAALLALLGLLHPVGGRRYHDMARLLTYNIHQGYDVAGVPAMQEIAGEIARIDADVIALQEVGRGWDMVGGVDLIAYLRYRFPDYQVDYVPLNGQLLGLALMTRIPLAGGHRARVFDAPPSAFKYGYDAWSVPVQQKQVTLVALHLSAGLEGHGTDTRVDQMNQLMRAFARDSAVIIAGDFNTQPHEPPVQNLLRAGYRDVAAAAGLDAVRTWPADRPYERDDYVFLRANVTPTRVGVLHTLASDHLPLVVDFR